MSRSVWGDFFSIAVLDGFGLFALTCMGREVIWSNLMKISTRNDRLKLAPPGRGVGCGQRVGAEG